MKTLSATLATLFLGICVSAGVEGQGANPPTDAGFQWLPFPDNARFKVEGLNWFGQNSPKLWRMPGNTMDSLPKGVQVQSKCASGARIVLRCTTTRLAVQAVAQKGGGLKAFGTYVDGQSCKATVGERAGDGIELLLFKELDNREKEIVIYLPQAQEVSIKAIGVDPAARFSRPEHRYARPLPVVFYGSSVCQGSGAANAGQTYEAILCRELNLDFINLGFGGAGKAETNVVDLVNSVPACCYAFDLGKSYGMQDGSAFKAMLLTVRRSHPDIPIIVMTPITSATEVRDASYAALSLHTRAVMRDAANEMIKAGATQMFLVEGEDLLGFDEHAGLSKDGVHPSDQGYGRIAKKLSPVFKRALGL